MRPRICRPFSSSTRARIEPPSLTREPRGPFGVMAVEGILDQFCISRASPGQITKVRHSALAAPRTAFPFQVGAAAPHMRKCSAVGGDDNDNDEANGCAGIGGLHDDPRF